MPDRAFVMFLETNMLYGDMFDALLEKCPGWSYPTYFATSFGSECHIQWWNYTKRELLKSKFLEGSLQVAGYYALPKEVPPDVMEKPPTVPQLGKLVVTSTGSDRTLSILDANIKQWYHHPLFGPRFRAFVDQF